MAKILYIIITVQAFFISGQCLAQGWVAEVNLDFNHDLYAFENITSASVTFSGIKVTGSSPISSLEFVIRGTGPITGNLSVIVSGLAWEPYDRQNPESEPIAATYTGNYQTTCNTAFFEKAGEEPDEQIYIWIKIYPRIDISDFLQKCDELLLSTNTCSPAFMWEVSDSPTGQFKLIPGKNSPNIAITREELVSMGFNNPFGRKYFRVTGLFNTTSELQPVDIYYPGPSANLTAIPPKCHNGSDGSVKMDIISAYSQINDFVVTLFRLNPSANPISQQIIIDGAITGFGNLTAGKYQVKIENYSSIDIYGNCWALYEFDLGNPTPVQISSVDRPDFHGYQLRCKGDMNGRIEVRPSGGTNTFVTYEWLPAVSNTAVAQNLPEGTYSVKVRDSNLCWSQQYSYAITAPEKLTIKLQSTGGKSGFDVTCADKNDGVILSEPGGGVSPYAFQWSTGSTAPNIDGLGAGTHQVVATDVNGCFVNGSIELRAPAPITFSIAQITPVSCPGTSTGILEVQSLRNNIGEVAYSWSSGENTPMVANKPAGEYSVTVSDAQGCRATGSHRLDDAQAYSVEIVPSSDFNGSHIRCNGEANGELTTMVRDQAGALTRAEHYLWTKNGSHLASGMSVTGVSDLESGIYGIEITYGAGCTSKNHFVLAQPEPVSVTISNTSNYNGMPISCAGRTDGSLLASASGGTGKTYAYAWENGESTAQLKELGTGTYTVVASDINGCKTNASKTLSEPAQLQTNITVLSNFNGQPISCANAADARLNASASGGTPPFSYEWDTGPVTAELGGLGAGTYTVLGRDANGCTDMSEATIADPPRVVATISGASNYNGFGVSCFGSTDGYLLASGTGGTGKYLFAWEGSSNPSALYENLAKGTYKVTVSDQNGCSNTIEAMILEPDPLSINAWETKDVSCYGAEDGQIHLSPTGGAGEYTFSISNIIRQNEPVLSGLKAGLYEPVVHDVNGCSQSIRITVIEPPPITIEFPTIEPALCGEARGKITATATGGSGKYQYTWKNSREEIIGETPQLAGLTSGIYTIHVADEASCAASLSAGVPTSDGPKVIRTDIIPTTCSYTQDGKASLATIAGEGPFSFEWPDGQQTAEVTNLRKGTYLVRVRDIHSCLTVESVTIASPDTLKIDLLEGIEPTCYGYCDGRLTVEATGGNGEFVYSWQSHQGSSINNLCAGNYTVTVEDLKACVTTATFAITQPDPVTVRTIVNAPPTCPGGCDGQLEIKASGGTGALNYEWSDGQTGPKLESLCSGAYKTIIKDSNHCSIETSYLLAEPEASSLDLGGPMLLCKGQGHTLDAGAGWKEYLWKSGNGFQSRGREVLLTDAGSYSLEVVDQKGCVVRDTFILQTSDDLLQTNFLMSAEGSIGDTIVMIDISWPVPQHVSWIFPEEMQRINDFGDIIYGQFEVAGTFSVTLKGMLGECRDELTKTISIIDTLREDGVGRLGYESFVKVFSLYPNPNEGAFDVLVEFIEESAMTLSVWNDLTGRKISELHDSGSPSYSGHFDLRPLSAGSYTLRLDYRHGTRYVRFIVR